MRVALVTTPRCVRSGIGDYTWQLLPHLREHCQVDVYVADGFEAEAPELRPASALDPSASERILYQLGNERAHAFMVPMVRELGGVVALHDWVLFDLITAAHGELERGGFRGQVAALRHGGLSQARIYARLRARRRVARGERARGFRDEPGLAAGGLSSGWHAPEEGGRWAQGEAGLRLVGKGLNKVHLELDIPARRDVRLCSSGATLARTRTCGPTTLSADLQTASSADLTLCARPTPPTDEQRARGDTRELGVFVRGVTYTDDVGEHHVDLSVPITAAPLAPGLSSARFELPLNRSIVRLADAFLVHSAWMRDQILAERNAPTPIGIVPHGAQSTRRVGDRRDCRAGLGLREDAILLTSFGAIQEHKRPELLLRAFARARCEEPSLQLVLGGESRLEQLDLQGLIEELGLEDAVKVTGYLDEASIDDHLFAADLCVNLRGPSTGGTSGAIARALGMGRMVIASDLGEQSELPESCVARVAPGPSEEQELARTILALVRDREQRAQGEAAARSHVEEQLEWSVAGQRYAQLLDRLPAHRTRRKSLIRTAIDTADRSRAERRKTRDDERAGSGARGGPSAP